MEISVKTDEQFYTLANLMPTLCWMARADGWIYWYNSRWFEYTGTTAEQMEGWGWQSVHDPAVLPDVLIGWKASIREGKSFEMTFPLKSASGKFRPFLTRITPLFDADGVLIRWLGVNTDISTERNALELREPFMAILGHDLRNPLSAIGAGLSIVANTPLNERAASVTRMMQASAARMHGLINNLMDLARGRLGDGINLDVKPSTNLEAVLREVIAELHTTTPDREVDFRFRLSDVVNCDHDRVAQLFSNLLGNAITYGLPDKPVLVEASSENGVFELSVSNAGAPISPDDIERLFQPFYRGAVRSSRQGLGLGLYIAFEIATAHGGTLDVASDAQETRFTFSMPL